MNISEIKALVMHQTNNDVEDMDEFMPYLSGYIYAGYVKLMQAWDSGAEIPRLPEFVSDIPFLPEWTHSALADYATYCIYRNGNSQKQQRGYAFLTNFEDVRKSILSQGGKNGKATQFINIPR